MKPPKEHSRARSIDRLVGADDDAHGVPSLAISTTCASGQVNQPDALKDLSPIARSSSPSHSDALSFGRLDPSSRQSSLSSLSSRLHRNWATANNLEAGPTLAMAPESRRSSQLLDQRPSRPTSPSLIARERSEDRFDRAKDEYRRRLGVEQSAARERSSSITQRPPSSLAQTACPPSPDDEIAFRQQNDQEGWHRNDQSSENSPLGGSSRGLALSSSEDQFSAMSQSESNPSIPSVASAGSPNQGACGSFDEHSWISPVSGSRFEASIDDADGYDGDHAIESEEEDEDSEDELVMSFAKKKTPAAPSSHRSNSVSNGELARANFHAGINSRRRSTRSGSNGTVKKVPPPELEPAHDDRTAESQ